MPKNGSSRSKRRARRLAIQNNSRYTEALRHTRTGEREPEQDDGDETPTEIGPTALEALHTIVERVKSTDPAETTAGLAIIYEALSLTAIANRLVHEALLEFGEVYWPGENFLVDGRQQRLDRAVEGLGTALCASTQPHGQLSMLTTADTAPQVYQPYQPDGYDGVVCDPDPTEKDRQLLLLRTHSVTLANKTVWTQVGILLARILTGVRDPEQRKACRIATVVVEEILHPNSQATGRDIDQRILAVTVGRRSAAELVSDEVLMQLLYSSVTATAQPNNWSPMSAVSAALEHTDRDWTPARRGYSSDIKLIAATKQFSIRRRPRKGQEIVEIRARRGTGQASRGGSTC